MITMYSTRTETKKYCAEQGIDVLHGIYAQLYALCTETDLSNSQIADLLGYATATVRIYRKEKIYNYANLAKEMFTEYVKAVKPPEGAIERKFRDGRPSVYINFIGNCMNLQNQQAVYFFKFYNGKELLFCKIGTTKKDILQRLKQEIYTYSKNFTITNVEIHRTYSCGNQPAEGAESALRAAFIKLYPNNYCKNDRFFNVDISADLFDKYIQEHFA